MYCSPSCFALLTKKSDSSFKCLILKTKFKIKYTFYNNLMLNVIILTPIAINDDNCMQQLQSNSLWWRSYPWKSYTCTSNSDHSEAFAKNKVFYPLKKLMFYMQKKCWTNHINKIEEHTAIAIISTAVHTGTIQCIVLT